MPQRKPGPHALIFVAITVLLDTIGFGLVTPVWPKLLVELTGDTLSQAAVIGGRLALVYALLQFVCAPILGGLSDRFGRRPVLLYAVGSLGVDYLIMGIAPTLGWLFLGRAISGIAGASFSPAYACVADLSPPERRAQNFGVISACFGIGFIVGPAIGGLLAGLGPRAPFFAAAALSLANLIYGVFVLPETLPPERRRAFDWKRANPLGALVHMSRRRVVFGILTALFLWSVAHQVMPATWAFYTKYRFDWSERTIGWSLAFAGVVMAASQALLVRRLVPRLGERRAALLGIAMATIGNVGYGLSTEGWMMFAWLSTWFFGAAVMPSSNGLMSRLVPPDAQGELQGAVASLFSLASIVGPPLLTTIFARFTGPDAPAHVPGAAFLTAALLSATCFVLYARATRGVTMVAARPAGTESPTTPTAEEMA
jgi:DHA1 family tetracycline resistance protein-like MFS transporter